jgi:hypothetical protein
LPAAVVRASLIFRDGESVVVLAAMHEPRLTCLIVVDLVSPTPVADCFYALDAAPSPDRLRVAFTRFYPLHFSSSPTEDQTFVFSTRAALMFEEAPGRAGLDAIAKLSARVGSRILTDTGVRRDSPNVLLDGRSPRLLASDYAWSADGSVLAFVERRSPNEFAFISADFAEASLPKVVRRPFVPPLGADGRVFSIDLADKQRPIVLARGQSRDGQRASPVQWQSNARFIPQ